jgi:Flp pilus assembly protein protease CpaA
MSNILYLNFLDVSDLSSIRIPNKLLLSCLVLDEEVMKFQGKRVFDPEDDLHLIQVSESVMMGSNKRVFESRDKSLFGKVQKEHSKK